jgi:hypothetical protein
MGPRKNSFTFDCLAPWRRHSCLMRLSFRAIEHPAWIVLLLAVFSARRDELWGRFSICGGLSIRLPPLDAPATPLENRHHSLRLCRYVGQDGILRAGWQPALVGLFTGDPGRLPTCPTTSVEFPFLGRLSGIRHSCLPGVLPSASRGVGGALWARQSETLRHVAAASLFLRGSYA